MGTFLHFYGYSIKRMIHRLYSWKCNWEKKKQKQTKFELFNKNPQCFTNTSMLLLTSQEAELLGWLLQQGMSRPWDPCTAQDTNPGTEQLRPL